MSVPLLFDIIVGLQRSSERSHVLRSKICHQINVNCGPGDTVSRTGDRPTYVVVNLQLFENVNCRVKCRQYVWWSHL